MELSAVAKFHTLTLSFLRAQHCIRLLLEDSKRISGKGPFLQLREASPWGQKAVRRAAKGRRSKELRGTTPLFSWKKEKDGPPSSHRITDPSLSSSGAGSSGGRGKQGRFAAGAPGARLQGSGSLGSLASEPGQGSRGSRAPGSALHRAPPATGGPDAPRPPGARPRTPRPLHAPPCSLRAAAAAVHSPRRWAALRLRLGLWRRCWPRLLHGGCRGDGEGGRGHRLGDGVSHPCTKLRMTAAGRQLQPGAGRPGAAG